MGRINYLWTLSSNFVKHTGHLSLSPSFLRPHLYCLTLIFFFSPSKVAYGALRWIRSTGIFFCMAKPLGVFTEQFCLTDLFRCIRMSIVIIYEFLLLKVV